jgi:squalene synthase HpnC
MTLENAYRHCSGIAGEHYENFPVASRLLPSRLRPHIAAVYAWARHADDLADEGSVPADERLVALRAWGEAFDRMRAGEKDGDPVTMAVSDTVQRFRIPPQLLHDLLDAFSQDAVMAEYERFDDVLDYCRRSANPVGRIVLALFGLLDVTRTAASDALCTGLQLANFWQDVSVDRLKPRCYIPKEDLQRFGLSMGDILHGYDSDATRSLMRFEVERTRGFFRAALPLLPSLPLRLRLEISATWRGGWGILAKIDEVQYNVLSRRPVLGRMDLIRLVAAAPFKPQAERPADG